MKVIKLIGILLIILALLAGGGLFYLRNYYQNAITDTSGSDEIVQVEIPAGSNSEQITTILAENGLIDNETVFRFYLRESDKGSQLKAGEYEFRKNQSMIDITDELVNGAVAKGIRVTIIEGLRYDEVVDSLFEQFSDTDNILSSETLTEIIENPDNYDFGSEVNTTLAEVKPAGNNLEGFLYPDTYEFAKDADELAVITTMLENFNDKYQQLPEPQRYSSYEYLILSSIVQREAFVGEYPEIAGIFVRRLNVGDRLGADATVLYPYKRWKPEPTAPELREDTAYNTRLNTGLTPTPISSPGFDAMQGTWNAEESEYYYFIHGNDGNTYFAKTLAEHEANIARYLN
jgi:UPF0755 protein